MAKIEIVIPGLPHSMNPVRGQSKVDVTVRTDIAIRPIAVFMPVAWILDSVTAKGVGEILGRVGPDRLAIKACMKGITLYPFPPEAVALPGAVDLTFRVFNPLERENLFPGCKMIAETVP